MQYAHVRQLWKEAYLLEIIKNFQIFFWINTKFLKGLIVRTCWDLQERVSNNAVKNIKIDLGEYKKLNDCCFSKT